MTVALTYCAGLRNVVTGRVVPQPAALGPDLGSDLGTGAVEGMGSDLGAGGVAGMASDPGAGAVGRGAGDSNVAACAAMFEPFSDQSDTAYRAPVTPESGTFRTAALEWAALGVLPATPAA